MELKWEEQEKDCLFSENFGVSDKRVDELSRIVYKNIMDTDSWDDALKKSLGSATNDMEMLFIAVLFGDMRAKLIRLWEF